MGSTGSRLAGMYHIKDSTGACLHDGLGFAGCSDDEAQTWSFAGNVDVIRSSTKDRCIQAEVGGEWGEVTLENCTTSNPGQQWTVTNQNQLSATINGCTDRLSAQRGLSAQWGQGCCLERLDSTVKLWSCDEYYTQIWSFESIPGPAQSPGPAPRDTCAEIGCGTYSDDLPCQCDSNCRGYGNCCSDFETSCSGGDTCAEIGCDTYFDDDLPCQCDYNCQNYGNCCSDFETSCSGGDTCAEIGCDAYYDEDLPCQCDYQCQNEGNCCSDYETRCGGSNEATLESIPGPAQSPGPAPRDTCAEIGCGVYSDDLPCQCDSNCRGYGNCCSDYETSCSRADTCAEIGCDAPYDPDLCACDYICQNEGNCCPDYETTCGGSSEATLV